jgi:hypothetical protein
MIRSGRLISDSMVYLIVCDIVSQSCPFFDISTRPDPPVFRIAFETSAEKTKQLLIIVPTTLFS